MVMPAEGQLDNPRNPLPPKRVAESIITLSQVIFPRDTNELGLATAGVILKTIDIAASLATAKHSGKKIVTASLDRMDFIHPAKIWELVTTTSFLTRTWTTSMETQVVVQAENIRTGEKRRVASGYLVFVGMEGEPLKPSPVPPLWLETPEEVQRAQEAEIRRASRLAEATHMGERALTAIDDSDVPEVVKRTMTPDDSNIHQNVFGGIILELVHQAGSKAAFHHAKAPVIAVRQDRMSFEQPAYIGEEVKAKAVITRTWHTSLEVQVDVIARDHKTQEQRNVASSFLVFVAQDPQGHPKSVPAFTPRTAKQQLRWEQAEQRQRTRLQERQAVLQTLDV